MWTREELQRRDLRTRKLMTMNYALHHSDDLGRVYVSIKGGGRGLASIQDCVDESIQQREDHIQKCGGKLIIMTGNNADNTSINKQK